MFKKVTRIKYFLFTGFVFLILLLLLCFNSQDVPDLEWTMVNVNYSQKQGDANIIRIKGGKTILIDAGYPGEAHKALLPFLRKNAIEKIDIVFISHPHKDHYGGLYPLLKSGIQMEEVYFNVPDKSICDSEIPWGCDHDDVLRLQKKLEENKVQVKTANAGQRFDLGPETWIEILYAFDGVNTPVGKTDINDMSLIMMLHHRELKVLFTGDLNKKLGTYLAKFPAVIASDILKVPHHGTETVAPNEFFDSVAPQHALVPAPKHLWLSQRSKRIRDWFSDNKVPVYVNGISGDIRVAVVDNVLTVQTQREDL